MNLEVTPEELHLIRYACNEMANRRLEQAFDAKHGHTGSLVNVEGYVQTSRAEATAYESIAAKASECFRQQERLKANSKIP